MIKKVVDIYMDEEELQQEKVEELYDAIDEAKTEAEYDFIEAVSDKLGRGNRLTEDQWRRVQKLHSVYVGLKK